MLLVPFVVVTTVKHQEAQDGATVDWGSLDESPANRP